MNDVVFDSPEPRRSRWRMPWQWVRISGPSMVPTLHHDDEVLVWRSVRRGASIRAGDVVLARFVTMPDRLVVKRADRPVDDGWWLVSDNPHAGGDSAVHGAAVVLGRVVLVVRPGRPRLVHRRR